jgi:hypothetical protein
MTKTEQTNLNWKQSTVLIGYNYAVNWDVNLDAIYTTITHEGKSILFTTARVPTYPHNDSFTDMNLPNGPAFRYRTREFAEKQSWKKFDFARQNKHLCNYEGSISHSLCRNYFV